MGASSIACPGIRTPNRSGAEKRLTLVAVGFILSLMETIKKCGRCGCEQTAASWAALRYVGKTVDSVETIEMRLCAAPCNSTMARVQS